MNILKSRRDSQPTKSSKKDKETSTPAMIPYRTSTGEIAYSPDPAAPLPKAAAPTEEEDGIAPLIPASNPADQLSPQELDSLQHFTATGKPIPRSKPSNLLYVGMGDSGGHMPPQLLPQRYTDESIIPVVVKVGPSSGSNTSAPAAEGGDEAAAAQAPRKKSGGFLSKLKAASNAGVSGGPGKDGEEVKVIFMPRREYLKYFAKDDQGRYTGTEPERKWSAEELEREFGKYKK